MSESGPGTGKPEVRFLEVEEDYAGQRLDNFLLRELKGLPRTRLYRALRKGEVRVNKGRVKANYRLQQGDIVRIPPLRLAPASEPKAAPGRWRKLLSQSVLYEDEGLLVIDKPSGLAVHGGSGLSSGLIETLREMRSGDHYLELVHRLDRETSGILLVARKPAVLRDLHRQLREDRMEKRYLALVQGKWPRSRCFVDAPLQKNSLKSGERIVRVDKGGKTARTDFRVVQSYGECSLVEAQPKTGRTHQIRVHVQHAGHPIIGDQKYAPREINQWAKKRGLKRLFLHAASLEFEYGEHGRLLFEAAPGPDLSQFLDSLGK